jgi:hypothetical protein
MDPYVSRKHAVLRVLTDGNYQLEDLSSTGGTYLINTDGTDRRIVKSMVSHNTQVRLGAHYMLNMTELIGFMENKQKQHNELLLKFTALKQTYDHYLTEKIRLQKNMNMKNFYRTLPSVICPLLLVVTMVMGDSQTVVVLRYAIGAATVGLIGYTALGVHKAYQEQPALIEELNKQFMIDYVCPKCGNFLGFVPYDTLANKKICSFCKCQWIEK